MDIPLLETEIPIIKKKHKNQRIVPCIGSGIERDVADWTSYLLKYCEMLKRCCNHQIYSNNRVFTSKKEKHIKLICEVEALIASDPIGVNSAFGLLEIVRNDLKTINNGFFVEAEKNLIEVFSSISPNISHQSIIKAKFNLILTKNWTRALPKADLDLNGMYSSSILNYYDYQGIGLAISSKVPSIIYMHGKVDEPNYPILKGDTDYMAFRELFPYSYELFKTVFTFYDILFIGCSALDSAPYHYIEEVNKLKLTSRQSSFEFPTYYWILPEAEINEMPDYKLIVDTNRGIKYLQVSNDFRELDQLYRALEAA